MILNGKGLHSLLLFVQLIDEVLSLSLSLQSCDHRGLQLHHEHEIDVSTSCLTSCTMLPTVCTTDVIVHAKGADAKFPTPHRIASQPGDPGASD